MNTLSAIFIATTLHLGLPPGLLSSLCFVETNHDIAAIHVDDGQGDSLGICQIKLRTAQWLGYKGTDEQLMNPQVNIYWSGVYLKYQIRRYGSIERAVIAYNIGNARNLTTTNYQVKVFKVWREQ